MKSARLILVGAVMSLACLNTSLAQPPAQDSSVTLYSVQKHRGEQRNFCLNFQKGPSTLSRADCDLAYGLLYAGDEFDWFQSASSQGNRSVIKDLGEHDWSTWFAVPVVEPLAKLKPGEQRNITVDVSGADGADGAPGARGAPAVPGADADGVVRQKATKADSADAGASGTESPRPKRDGKPKVDPLFVKAIVGHIYVIHVVDDSRDFYALFRVEALQRGDNCTVSWKLIPEPMNPSSENTSR